MRRKRGRSCGAPPGKRSEGVDQAAAASARPPPTCPIEVHRRVAREAASDFQQPGRLPRRRQRRHGARIRELWVHRHGRRTSKRLPDLARVAAIRTSLEAALRPLMCRTERSRISPDAQPIRGEHVDLHPADVGAFRNFDVTSPNYRDWAVPLWSSVPLPMQTLGVRYQAWAGSRLEAWGSSGRAGRSSATIFRPSSRFLIPGCAPC